MVDAERSVAITESLEPAPSPNNETVLESRTRARFSPPNTAQASRETRADSAAAPVSPPASDRNATTSAQVKTSASPQPLTTLDPKPQSQTSCPKAQIATQDDQRPQGTAPINVATMAVGALTGAFRRPETRSQPPTPAAPADPRPSAPQSLLHRFAVKTILDTLRGPQDQIRATPKTGPEAATAGASASTNTTLALTTNTAASPGGLRDKLATFTAKRMQPRRDAEQVRDVTQAAAGVLASLQAIEHQETTGILTRIRDAAKTNGGIENVLSEMRPGGQFEDLRKAFNTILSHDQGFAAAYDKATGAIADYAETRAALAPRRGPAATLISPACKPSTRRSPKPQKPFQGSRMGSRRSRTLSRAARRRCKNSSRPSSRLLIAAPICGAPPRAPVSGDSPPSPDFYAGGAMKPPAFFPFVFAPLSATLGQPPGGRP